MIRLIPKLAPRNAPPSPRRGEGQGGGRKPTSLAARWRAHRHRARSAARGLHRRGRAKWIAAALLTLPCFLLLSVNPSDAVAALRARAELRRQTIAMAERMGLDPQAVLDPIGYQRKLARAAEKERDLQVFWMRQRTAPDELALNAHRRDVQETQDNYAIHELAAILEDLTELDRALTDLEAGKDTTHLIVALERASLRHWEDVLDRYDAAMKRKLRTAPREAQRRHDAFVRDTRTRLARIAGHVARATDARGVGEPANLRTQKPIDKKRLARIRPDVATIAGTRSGLVRPPRPAVRGPREIVPAPRRSVALGDRTVDPELLESATRRFAPSTGQKAAGLMRSFAGGAAPGMAPLPLHTAALLLRGGVLPLFLPPGAADTQPTLDAPHTPAIVALAADLGHEPIRIFNFVHDTIDTEIYLGSRKGAAGTLAERAGNDVDQASLLVALLRASGIPARYERVVIRLAPDQWKAYTGVNDVDQAASMLATVGLPAVITDIPDETGQIVSHIDTPIMAVRAYVPFSDYRGHDTGHGGASAWVPLLPSLKAYATADAVDLRPGAIFDFDAYLSQLTTESPLEVWEAQLRAYILAQGINCETLASAQPTRTIIPENLPYLRAELPATELSSLGALAEVPDAMRDRVRLTIRQPSRAPVLEHTATLVELYGSRIEITYEPATADDAAIIASHGGLEATPLYLVKLAATLRIDGAVVATGPAQVPGTDNPMTVTFLDDGREVASIPHTSRVGSLYVWAFDAGSMSSARLDDAEIALAEEADGTEAKQLARLRVMATRYFVEYNRARDRVAGIFHSRALTDPSELLVAYELNVTSTGGAPLSGTRDMVLFDVGRTLTTPFSLERGAEQRAHQKLLLGHHASALEHIVPATSHGPNMYSAVRFVQQAHDAGITVYEFDAADVDAYLPLLSVDDGIKDAIAAKAKPGRRLRVPAATFTPPLFRPVYGFISYNPTNGGAEYSFNGVFDGGGGLAGTPAPGSGTGCTGCGAASAPAGSQVVLARGNYVHDEVDLTVPARGIPIAFSRTYHSYFPTGGGHLGAGWIHSYADHIRPTPTGILYVTEAGEWPYESDGMGGFVEPPGFQGRIVELAEGGYTFTHRDGRVDTFDAAGKLLSQYDLNGNVVTLQYDASGRLATVTDATSRVVLTFAYGPDGLLDQVTDIAGRTVAYTHDAAGDLVAVTNVTNDTRTFTYDAEHRMLSHTDYRGNAWTLSYDDQGRWVRTEDPLGHTYTASYDRVRGRAVHTDRRGATTSYEITDRGELAARTDALGNRTAYSYDLRGNVTSVADPRGGVTTYAYDADDNVTETLDASNVLTTYTYGPHNRLVSTVEDAGGLARTTANTFDAAGNLLSSTDPLGHVSSFTYGANGLPATMTQPGSATTALAFDAAGNLDTLTDPEGGVTDFDSNAAGHLLRIEDPNHNVTTMVTDAAGRVLSTTDPENNVTSSTFDADGNLLTSTDAALATTTHTYDALGRRITTEDALGHVTRTEYDPEGAITASIDADGHRVTFTHDALGRTIATTDPTGATTHTGYCASIAQPCDVVDAAGNILQRSFDLEGRLTSQTDPLGFTTAMVYDALGRQVLTVDPAGRTTETLYDAAGRVTGVRDALGHLTEYTYDGRGNRTSYIDANGHATTFTYDLANRVLTQTNPLGITTTFTYDDAGSLATKLDGNGNLTTYLYDASRRLTDRIYADGTRHTFAYDARGLRTSESSPAITRTFTYDELGRMEAVTDHRFAEPRVLRYTYDARGNRASMTLEPENRRTTYRYDARGLLSELTDPDGDTVTYRYDVLGRRTALRYPNGILGTTTYNERSDTTGIVWTRTATQQIVAASLYTYDERGNRTTKTYEDGGVERYEYDAVSRLVAASYPGGHRRVTYDYDPVGNRLRMVEALLSDTDQPIPGCNTVLDPDCDGVPSHLDNCPDTFNPGQANADGQTFVDTFDDSSSLTHYTAFNPQTGNDAVWAIDDGRLSPGPSRGSGGGAGFEGPTLVRAGFDDEGSLRLSANLHMTSSVDRGIGLVFRWQDEQNHYRFHNNQQGTYHFQRLEKIEAGVLTVLAENDTPVGSGVNQRFTVVADGPVLDVYQGPSLVLHAEDATFPAGSVGLYAWLSGGARFDDLVASNADPRGDACDPCPGVVDGSCTAACDDADGDGFGTTVGACGQPRADCNDADPAVSPAADELCDGLDNDCDGLVDERCALAVTDYSYNEFNQLLAVADDHPLTTFAYDSNGNQLERSTPSRTTTMSYDFDNRMVGLQDGIRDPWVFSYDSDGLMISRDSGGDSRVLVVDPALQVEVAAFASPAELVEEYGQHPDIPDEHIYAQTAGVDAEKQWSLHDGLRSVVATSHGSGVLAAIHRYDAFGGDDSQSAGFLFSGRYWVTSDALRLGYYRQRWYDPDSGRFTQSDPLRDIDGPNLYAALGGNPVRNIDPNGTTFECAVGVVAGVAWMYAGIRMLAQATRPFNEDIFELGLAYLLAGISLILLLCRTQCRAGKPKVAGSLSGTPERSNIIPANDLAKLPVSAPGKDTVVLGHYTVPVKQGGTTIGVRDTLTDVLSPAAKQLQGRTLESLPKDINVIRPELLKADRIVFFTSKGMTGTTAQEMALIQSSRALRDKTVFVTGGM